MSMISRSSRVEVFRSRRTSLVLWLTVIVLGSTLTLRTRAADAPNPTQPELGPYTGPSVETIDAHTIEGKVLCGYQGWFNTPGDGTKFGFTHWGQGLDRSEGGHFTVDLWPDLTEYDPRDLTVVPRLQMPDGSPARLYSAYRPGPVLLHMKWVRQYGLDGVFLSRFVGEAASRSRSVHVNQVLANVREGCHREGRIWAVMMDLSMGKNTSTTAVINDWKFLCDRSEVREDSRYIHERGKPVVFLWGLGFKDRNWTVAQADELLHFFHDDPTYGGVYLIGGVDPSWRTLHGSSNTEPDWARIYRSFDSISPWDAGRYRDDASMDHMRDKIWKDDLVELNALHKGYMPTAFPGFSWDNLQKKPPGTTQIPRRKGEFFWRQFAIFKSLGVKTVFVGMFDEVDEGTAIYKVANVTPVGPYFLTYDGLPSDYYLKLTGLMTQLMRGPAPFPEHIPATLPKNKNDPAYEPRFQRSSHVPDQNRAARPSGATAGRRACDGRANSIIAIPVVD